MSGSTWFQKYLLPGLAFKAVVIGGGYATGRELAEFFLPAGPWGGVLGMLLATAIWSGIAVATFLFASVVGARDYRTFFRALLGPGWPAFEAAFGLSVVVMLAVFGLAAGAIGEALFGWPTVVGALGLVSCIALVTALGNAAVEQLFKWVSFLLYGVYAVFVILALTRFGDRVLATFQTAGPPGDSWALGGLTYAGYNVLGAVIILPMTRHLLTRRDAVVAGVVAGPLAMLPALFFYACMMAYYPQIGALALPSDYLLQRLDAPLFHVLFQLMIFSALLESGAGAVHAINERVAVAWRKRGELGAGARLAIAGVLLVGSVFLAQRFGLVALIAGGYRFIAYVFLAIYALPLLTYGVWRIWRAAKANALP